MTESPESAGQRLAAVLKTWDAFEECLLHDLRLTRFGFGVDLTFNLVRDENGEVRDDVLERPVLVTLTLSGVEALRLSGGLTDAMREDPESVNWGLGEIALVEQYTPARGVGLRVVWESDRSIEAEFGNLTVSTDRTSRAD
nr:immunity 50 family protein [Streptomyces sp. NBC_00830]WTB35772.1 immunity 50 family protein [Streptomyces sp. NBC_00830]